MNEFMKQAIYLSHKHMLNGDGGPFGAVIVKDNHIIAEGWNQVTSSQDPTAHAEVVAIRRAAQKLHSFDLSGTEIYTNCEPCPMCLGAIYWAHIGKIYYSCTKHDAARIDFDDEFIYHELATPLPQRKIPMIQVEDPEALSIFNEWSTKKDKIKY